MARARDHVHVQRAEREEYPVHEVVDARLELGTQVQRRGLEEREGGLDTCLFAARCLVLLLAAI